MTACNITSYLVLEHPMHSNSPAVAHAQCTTHQWSFGTAPVHVDGVCPLGRIEKATEEALEKIGLAALAAAL